MGLEEISALALLEAFPEPMVVMETDGTVVFTNPAAKVLLGVNELTPGTNILEFLPETERARLNPLQWMRRWAEAPGSPELAHVHLECRPRGGSNKPVRVRVARLRADGISRYVVMLHDITQEQARQQQTRAAHRLAARILAISADAVVNVDESMTILYANPSAERLFGYGSGALMGQPLAILLPERFRRAHETHMRDFARESAPARFMSDRAEVLGLTRSGEEIPLEASITKVTLDATQVLSAQLRDLRQRKAAAAELARSTARFRTLFDHALQAMALISPDGTVLEMNPAARELLPDDAPIQGQAFAELPFWSPAPGETTATLAAALERCLAGEPYRTTVHVRLPDGSERRLDFSLTPVQQDHQVFAVIAEARDLIAGRG